jgi:transcriptional regulator with XRE-family HTH domain
MISSIGDVFRDSRIQQGLQYKDLARMTGLSNSSVARIEKGDFGLTLGTCLLLVKALGIPINFFYEKITEKHFEISVEIKSPNERESPSIDDLILIGDYSASHMNECIDGLVQHLNLILNEILLTNPEYRLTTTNNPETYHFTANEILMYLDKGPKLREVRFDFPANLDFDHYSEIIKDGGAIIDEDVHIYCDRIMDKTQDDASYPKPFTTENIEKVLSFNHKRKLTNIENFKLNDIFLLDELGNRNGEFYYCCLQSINFERQWKSYREYKFARLLVVISRWKMYQGTSVPGWAMQIVHPLNSG